MTAHERRRDRYHDTVDVIVAWTAVLISVLFDSLIQGARVWASWAKHICSLIWGVVVNTYTGCGNFYHRCHEALALRLRRRFR